MTNPNFILAGTYPAGSGQLFAMLIQHPEIYLPLPMQPECNFFFKTTSYQLGMDAYRERWFANVQDEKAIGERSSLLLSGSAWAAERVAKELPDVRLIFMLRDPVARAYAHYRFTALAGFEELSFREALAAEDIRKRSMPPPFWSEIQPFSYFERGLYADQLQHWFDRFPREQMLLMRSDELLRDQATALTKIYRFLGVDETFQVGEAEEFSSPSVADPALQRRLRIEFGAELDAAIQRVRDNAPATCELDERFRANVLTRKQPLDADLASELRARYQESLARLEGLLPFAIGDWQS